jgi:hypothetical protein
MAPRSTRRSQETDHVTLLPGDRIRMQFTAARFLVHRTVFYPPLRVGKRDPRPGRAHP